jgi:hypothetical protein
MKESNYWDNHVSNKQKNAVARIIGVSAIERQIELTAALSIVGLKERKINAIRKCQERRARRETTQS